MKIPQPITHCGSWPKGWPFPFFHQILDSVGCVFMILAGGGGLAQKSQHFSIIIIDVEYLMNAPTNAHLFGAFYYHIERRRMLSPGIFCLTMLRQNGRKESFFSGWVFRREKSYLLAPHVEFVAALTVVERPNPSIWMSVFLFWGSILLRSWDFHLASARRVVEWVSICSRLHYWINHLLLYVFWSRKKKWHFQCDCWWRKCYVSRTLEMCLFYFWNVVYLLIGIKYKYILYFFSCDFFN